MYKFSCRGVRSNEMEMFRKTILKKMRAKNHKINQSQLSIKSYMKTEGNRDEDEIV